MDSVARLGILRDQRRLDVEVELTKYRVPGKKIATTLPPLWRGLRVDYLSAVHDALPTRAPGGATLDAVAVTDVEQATPAWEAGMRPGMLISHVQRSRGPHAPSVPRGGGVATRAGPAPRHR